jgi:hypothetical protein
MLKLVPTNDKILLNELSQQIFCKEFDLSVGFVFYINDKPAGLAKVKIAPDVSRLIEIGIVKSERGLGFGDFFTRSLLNALSMVSKRIIIDYASGYFNKFGFVKEGENMVIDAENLDFPRKCQEK